MLLACPLWFPIIVMQLLMLDFGFLIIGLAQQMMVQFISKIIMSQNSHQKQIQIFLQQQHQRRRPLLLILSQPQLHQVFVIENYNNTVLNHHAISHFGIFNLYQYLYEFTSLVIQAIRIKIIDWPIGTESIKTSNDYARQLPNVKTIGHVSLMTDYLKSVTRYTEPFYHALSHLNHTKIDNHLNRYGSVLF